MLLKQNLFGYENIKEKFMIQNLKKILTDYSYLT
jgi:hypothetical protein